MAILVEEFQAGLITKGPNVYLIFSVTVVVIVTVIVLYAMFIL